MDAVAHERRPMGGLEAAVLDCLWADGEPLTPRGVLDRIDGDLAYTTIMTILTRLWRKGLVERSRSGKAYAYTPLVSEADLVASRMRDALVSSADRGATLSRFAETLTKREATALRAALADLASGGRR